MFSRFTASARRVMQRAFREAKRCQHDFVGTLHLLYGLLCEESGPAVALMSMGLHVDGLLNREPHRGRLVRVFEREFPAFKRCHGRASPHTEGASYGVDLLIPSGGGRAKVRATRTRLDGAAFGSCMRAAFEAIRFPPPPSERPEIVSYSVLFKPGAR